MLANKVKPQTHEETPPQREYINSLTRHLTTPEDGKTLEKLTSDTMHATVEDRKYSRLCIIVKPKKGSLSYFSHKQSKVICHHREASLSVSLLARRI